MCKQHRKSYRENRQQQSKENCDNNMLASRRYRQKVDNIMKIQIQKKSKTKREQLCMAYLDVTKAKDKQWLDDIMYAMQPNSIMGPL